jgi:YjbE family integral membrane protein
MSYDEGCVTHRYTRHTEIGRLSVVLEQVLGPLGALGGIVLVDLALSGDNALVIGAAAASLPRRQRWFAIAAGGAGAIVLRIGFAIIATLLLTLAFIQALGGLVLLFIAVRLLVEQHSRKAVADEATPGGRAGRSMFAALLTILLADATMSLDNVLAIGALAHGDIPLLVVGLLLSIGILLIGSALVAELIERLPWLMDVAALVLGWTAATMLEHDKQVGPFLGQFPLSNIAIPVVTLGFVLVADIVIRLRARARQQPSAPAESGPSPASTSAAKN